MYGYRGKLSVPLKFPPALALYIWTLTSTGSAGASNARPWGRVLLCLEKAAKQSGSKSNAVANFLKICVQSWSSGPTTLMTRECKERDKPKGKT